MGSRPAQAVVQISACLAQLACATQVPHSSGWKMSLLW
jgi:hypothetical protein